VGHVAGMGEKRDVYRFWSGNVKKRAYSEDLGVDGRTVLGWILGI